MCIAMRAHDALTYGERRSPIRLSFQQNPRKPGLFIMRWPGSCNFSPSKISGRSSRMNAVVQIERRRTVRRLVKLKIAGILYAAEICANNYFSNDASSTKKVRKEYSGECRLPLTR